jgi:atypical dual specificity phosphatase
MKAFWWYKENEIAGMARPGFNCTRWFEFPFDQALVVGWIGQHSSGETRLADFHEHVHQYGAKILKFYDLTPDAASRIYQNLCDRNGLLATLKRLSDGSQLLEAYDVTESTLRFEFSQSRLESEIAFLKSQEIEQIVSLTERHHSKDLLDRHFDTYHFSINDLDPPRLHQVRELSEVLQNAKNSGRKLAVHCLAGIGRTSTMLIGAHLLMGESLDSLKAHVSRQNPAFVFTGKQAEFLLALAAELQSEEIQ